MDDQVNDHCSNPPPSWFLQMVDNFTVKGGVNESSIVNPPSSIGGKVSYMISIGSGKNIFGTTDINSTQKYKQ